MVIILTEYDYAFVSVVNSKFENTQGMKANFKGKLYPD